MSGGVPGLGRRQLLLPPPAVLVAERPQRHALLQHLRRPDTAVSDRCPPPALPACGEEAADASDVLHVCSTAIGAWEESDFDAFAAVAVPTVALSLPGVVAEGMLM